MCKQGELLELTDEEFEFKPYKYIGSYGYGLIFVDIKLKSSVENWYARSSDYKEIGVFNLPSNFLKAIGYDKENKILDWSYIE